MRRSLSKSALALLLGLTLVAGSAGAAKKDKRIEALSSTYQLWLEQVEFIISDEEREAFLAIEKDYERDAFIEQFWRLRDPYPETTRNEFKDRWLNLLSDAAALYGNTTEDRARMLLMNGPPDNQLVFNCTGVTWPLEIWFYDGSDRVPFEFFLLFAQMDGLKRYALWYPGDGLQELLDTTSAASGGGGGDVGRAIEACQNGYSVMRVIRQLLLQKMDFELTVHRITTIDSGPSAEWLATFESYSTDLPDDAEVFEANLEVSFPRPYQTRTVVEGTVQVATAEAQPLELADAASYHFELAGEILREGQLFEKFRYKFDFPADSITAGIIPMSFQRRLRPGSYKMILRLEDITSHKFNRQEHDLEVPLLDRAQPVLPADAESARILEAATAALSLGETTLELVPPRGEMLSQMARFDTLTTGDDIAEVVFSLDDKVSFKKRSPPFSVEFDLGSVPNTHVLRATAFDADGTELARDELVINGGSHRFDIRIVEPRPGGTYSGSVEVVTEVTVPKESVIERVELYLNDELLATLFQPPFVQTIELPAGNDLAYLRAVAYRPDQSSTEDIRFVNAPEYLEEVDVDFVELYTTVLDKDERPILDLEQGSFRVLEDGVEQTIVRFEHVRDLPIHAGIMLDVSASMEGNIATARDAALRFFEESIQPKDRAALITFNDHPLLAVEFTNDVDEMAAGLAGISAERGTALYDSLIFSLYYFNGIKGQRVLLLLSDGLDESSRFTYENALGYARRAGVAIYAIGLDISGKGAGAARKALNEIAGETGGRAFFIQDVAELSTIYAAIDEELRSRYLIGYQSSNTSEGGRFREVAVEVAEKGMEAKTIRGYYP